MSGRVVVPIYDNTGKYMVGCTGRSIHPYCEDCSSWHPIGFHTGKDGAYYWSKWRHNKNFEAENHLYNYWNAKDYIIKSGVVILVESPGNVWKLEQYEIHNSVGIFGTDLSFNQKMILDSSGAMSIILLLDPDNAGIEASKRIKEQCERQYRMFFPKIDVNCDIGDMTNDLVTNDIKPIIDKIVLSGV